MGILEECSVIRVTIVTRAAMRVCAGVKAGMSRRKARSMQRVHYDQRSKGKRECTPGQKN